MSHSAKLSPIRTRFPKPGKPFAFMAKLSPARRKTLFAWLTKDGGITYAQAQERIWRKWGIKTNSDQLSTFWQRYCQPRLMRTPVDSDGEVLFEIVIQIRRKKGEP